MTYEEMNKQAVCQLLTLIKKNPDLPVVCQIDDEDIGFSSSNCLAIGEITGCEIKELACVFGEVFDSEEALFEEYFIEDYDDEEYEDIRMDTAHYWRRVIVVHIDTPEIIHAW